MLLYYVRHGDPIYEPDSLTPLGKRQAEAISKRLAVYGLDEIYSSPLIRVLETARPTCEVLKKEATVLDWLNESESYKYLSVPDGNGESEWCYTNQQTKELFLHPEVRALGKKWYTHPLFAETEFATGVERIERESDSFLLGLGYRHDRERGLFIAEAPNEKRIAIFAHEGVGKLFLSAVLDIPYNEICTKFGIAHTGMTVINFHTVNGICIPEVLQLSNDSHLYREGLVTRYRNDIPI